MEKRKDIQIYIYNHKPLDYGVWDNSLYTPLEVGAALREPFMDQIRDNDSPDNISDMNPVYLELTGAYWIWKHSHPEKYKGAVQYRRRFEFPEEEDFDRIFDSYDAIACRPLRLPVRWQYQVCHSFKDMDVMERVVKDMHPEYADAWDRFINNGNYLYYSNGLIMRCQDFDRYCEWLFPILEKFMDEKGWKSVDDVRESVRRDIEAGERNSTRGENYQIEVPVFLSERLMTMYLMMNCRIYEVQYKKYEGISI